MKNKHFAILYLVIILGIAIKVFIWSQTSYVSRDSAFYLVRIIEWHEKGARYYLEESLDKSFFPPLFIFLTHCTMRLGTTELHAALLLNIFLGSLLPIVFYHLAYIFTRNKTIASIGMIIILLHPSVNKLSIEAQRDIGYLFCSLSYMLFIMNGILSRREVFCFFAGIFLACAILFRIEAIEMIPLTLLCICIQRVYKRINAMVYISIATVSFCFSFMILLKMMNFQTNDFKTLFNGYYREIIPYLF